MAKLSEKEIIVKLKALKQVHPGSIWVDFCREWLDNKITINERITTFSNSAERKTWTPAFLPKWAFAPVMAISVVILGSTGLVFASKDALPGDLLFPIKITFEKAQMFATPVSQRAGLQIHIANTRLKELNTVVADEKKSGQIIEAVKQLNNELTAVKKQLPAIAQNNKLQEAVKIAETATEITIKIPVAVIINSACDSFASSSCAVAEEENINNQNLPAIQTMKMAEEIIKNIEELSKKESSADSVLPINGSEQESNDLR